MSIINCIFTAISSNSNFIPYSMGPYYLLWHLHLFYLQSNIHFRCPWTYYTCSSSHEMLKGLPTLSIWSRERIWLKCLFLLRKLIILLNSIHAIWNIFQFLIFSIQLNWICVKLFFVSKLICTIKRLLNLFLVNYAN